MGVGSKTRPIGPQSGAGFLITAESGAKWFNHGSKWGGILNHVRKWVNHGSKSGGILNHGVLPD